MYIRVSNPLFLELGDSGRPAAGYLVWTLVAGTVDTLLTTYSDRELTAANTNPIVLDARGECHIFTSGAVKLVYTAPDGDLTSPIWTEDYVAEQQETVSDKGEGVHTGNNNYTLDIVPAYVSIPDGLSLVMIPDADCLGTLGATTFVGTGINDGIFSGQYVGLTAGAVFAVTIDACYVEDPTTAVTAAVSADIAVTPPDAGAHLIAVTYITDEGETLTGPTVSVVADGAHKIDVSNIPVGPTDKGITGRRIYMTEAAGADFYFVDEIADVTTTTYKIDIDDATLAANDAEPAANDTGDGSGADTFSWQIDGGASTDDVPIGSAGPQTLQDNIFIEFSNTTGHLLGDMWTTTVMTPVRLNFCSLGNKLVYKSEGGELVVLDADDIIANYPAHLDYSLAEDCWILINPSLPVLESLIPLRRRKEITSNYTVDPDADQGTEINATGTLTITLPDCTDAVSRFFYLRNDGSGVVTVDAGTYIIKDMFGGAGTTTITLGPSQAIQIATNGVDWHILSGLGFPILIESVDLTAAASHTFSTSVAPGFIYRLDYELMPSGACHLILRFNEDGGANYATACTYIWPDGTSHAYSGAVPYIALAPMTNTFLTTGQCRFNTIAGDNTKVAVLGSAYTYESVGGVCPCNCGGHYNGAADLVSVTVFLTGGTMTGRINLYRIA